MMGLLLGGIRLGKRLTSKANSTETIAPAAEVQGVCHL